MLEESAPGHWQSQMIEASRTAKPRHPYQRACQRDVRPVFGPVARGQDRRVFRPVSACGLGPPTLDSSTPTTTRIDHFRSIFASFPAAEPVHSFPLFGSCCSRIHIRIRIPKRQSVLSASGHFYRQSRHESTLVLKQSSLVVSLVY